jgi:hypothetical protein
MKEGVFMANKPKNKNGVLAAHAAEQMEGHAKSFLLNLEHYGISGVLYLKMPDDENNVVVFSKSESDKEYVKLLKLASVMSLAGAKAILDKQK